MEEALDLTFDRLLMMMMMMMMYHILVFVTYGVRICAPHYNFITLSTLFDTSRYNDDTICTYSHNTLPSILYNNESY